MAGKKNKDELNRFLGNVVDKVTSNFDVDEVILFGSYAKGTANDNSDIDVAVISSELNINYPIFENALTIIRKSDLYEPYLQLVPFHPDKYNKQDSFFTREIKRTGKKIYCKNSN